MTKIKKICNLVSQLAKQYHPDTNKETGAHDRFVEIQSAYDVRVLHTTRSWVFFIYLGYLLATQ